MRCWSVLLSSACALWAGLLVVVAPTAIACAQAPSPTLGALPVWWGAEVPVSPVVALCEGSQAFERCAQLCRSWPASSDCLLWLRFGDNVRADQRRRFRSQPIDAHGVGDIDAASDGLDAHREKRRSALRLWRQYHRPWPAYDAIQVPLAEARRLPRPSIEAALTLTAASELVGEATNDWGEALALADEAMAALGALDRTDPLALQVVGHYASILMAHGFPIEASDVQSAVAGLLVDALGTLHPRSLAARRAAASMLRQTGRPDDIGEAHRRLVAVLTDYLRVFGPTAAEVARAADQAPPGRLSVEATPIATIVTTAGIIETKRSGDCSRALDGYDEALKLRLAQPLDQRPWLSQARANVVETHLARGRLREARVHAELALEERARVWGPLHEKLSYPRSQLAKVLSAEGNVGKSRDARRASLLSGWRLHARLAGLVPLDLDVIDSVDWLRKNVSVTPEQDAQALPPREAIEVLVESRSSALRFEDAWRRLERIRRELPHEAAGLHLAWRAAEREREREAVRPGGPRPPSPGRDAAALERQLAAAWPPFAQRPRLRGYDGSFDELCQVLRTQRASLVMYVNVRAAGLCEPPNQPEVLVMKPVAGSCAVDRTMLNEGLVSATLAYEDAIGAVETSLTMRKGSTRTAAVRAAFTRLSTTSRALGALVWDPIEKLLPAEDRVWLSVDGPLEAIDFDTLLDQRGQPLIERWTLARLAYPASLLSPRSPSNGAPDLLLVSNVKLSSYDVGDPCPYAASWLSFKEAEADKEGLLPVLRRARIRFAVVEGQRATEANVVAELPRHRWVHLDTHGFSAAPDACAGEPRAWRALPRIPDEVRAFIERRTDPLRLAGVVLAKGRGPATDDDGYLTARELSRLELEAVELAVVSGCRTARGAPVAGEAMRSVARELVAAGARHVVASNWRIPAPLTAPFFARFYAALVEDPNDPVKALRRAKKGGRNITEEGMTSPYLWGGFTVVRGR